MAHRWQRWFLPGTGAGVAAGALLALAGAQDAADAAWLATTLTAVVPSAWWVWNGLRRRRLGVDVVALLALVGTIAIGEYLAGALIALMLATGRTLEAVANARARRDLEKLAAQQPTTVQRRRGSSLETVPVAAVHRGDVLVVGPAGVIAVDGTVVEDVAVVDESALTGEMLPVERRPGEPVRSGTVNAGGPFTMRAVATAADSTYAGIVRLVEQAEASSAPFVRLADRYAGAFLALSLLTAAAAWVLSGDPARSVAVLVVATPCPLILAAPVALVAGLSRAARRGIVVKGGGALERLADGRVLLFDKTGTITTGRPTLVDVIECGQHTPSDILRLAASVDQVSSHVLAAALVRAATRRGLLLTLPSRVEEQAGRGVRGDVDGHEVTVGKAAWVGASERDPWVRSARRRADLDGSLSVFVGIDGEPAGALLFDDPIRLDAAATVRALRRAGIDRIVLVTGDRQEVADAVGTIIGVDEVLAERSPLDKVEAVGVERAWGPTIMVGDGFNDAPALAAAGIGVALASSGASVASEAADAVITVPRLDRLGEGVAIARRARAVAVESVVAGVGLSVAAMGFAAAGLIPPAWGALLQEAIDLLVIANALRALRGGPGRRRRPAADEVALARRFAGEHTLLKPQLERVRSVADELGRPEGADGLQHARDLHRFLADELLPHEWAENDSLYPVIARSLGGDEPMASMRREHAEIGRQIRRLGRLLDGIDPDGADAEDILELRRLLYGLHAVLRLHFLLEDERYFAFVDDGTEPTPAGTEVSYDPSQRRIADSGHEDLSRARRP